MKISPRTGCLISIFSGFLLTAVLWLAFTLAIRQEIGFQTQNLTGYRLWIINAEDGRGWGFSRAAIADEGISRGRHCIETTTDFHFWGSQPQEPRQVYCECYKDVGGQWDYTGICEP